jgi:hypothetical protein
MRLGRAPWHPLVTIFVGGVLAALLGGALSRWLPTARRGVEDRSGPDRTKSGNMADAAFVGFLCGRYLGPVWGCSVIALTSITYWPLVNVTPFRRWPWIGVAAVWATALTLLAGVCIRLE